MKLLRNIITKLMRWMGNIISGEEPSINRVVLLEQYKVVLNRVVLIRIPIHLLQEV